jgi:hypothetical protein
VYPASILGRLWEGLGFEELLSHFDMCLFLPACARQISVVESIFKLQDSAPSSIVKTMRSSLIDSLT